MAIDKTNMKAIHDVLITDMQKRLFEQYKNYTDLGNKILTDEDYDNALSLMVNSILHTNNMRDVNDLLTEYCDLFTSYDELLVPTIDGTLNHIVGLLVNKCKSNVEPV